MADPTRRQPAEPAPTEADAPTEAAVPTDAAAPAPTAAGPAEAGPLAGWTIGITAARRADELAALLQR
ncbi:MAG: hypothetical protein LBV78_03970, partial [Kitasatospora sp.]|nr:hypothetical protein [Kitasatospora sp.]